MQIFIRSIDEITKPNFGNLIYSGLAKSLFRSQFKFQIGKATATKRTDLSIILFIPLKQFVNECVSMSLLAFWFIVVEDMPRDMQVQIFFLKYLLFI